MDIYGTLIYRRNLRTECSSCFVFKFSISPIDGISDLFGRGFDQ